MKLKLYIPTCDRYLWLMKPFSFLFNRFWDDSIDVIYLGYKTPEFINDMPSNFSFISMGDDDNLDNWSNDLRQYFDKIDDEYFMVTVDDSFLVDYTDIELYQKALLYLKETNNNIGRFGLERDLVTRPHQYWESFMGMNLVEAKPESTSRISLRWSIWKREYFCKYLKAGRIPWTFEANGTSESVNDGWGIVSFALKNPKKAPDNAVVFNTNAIWRNWFEDKNRLNLNDCAHDNPSKSLDKEILNEMIDLKYFNNEIEFGSIYNKEWYKIQ